MRAWARAPAREARRAVRLEKWQKEQLGEARARKTRNRTGWRLWRFPPRPSIDDKNASRLPFAGLQASTQQDMTWLRRDCTDRW